MSDAALAAIHTTESKSLIHGRARRVMRAPRCADTMDGRGYDHLCFFLLSVRESTQWKRGYASKKKDMCRDRWKDRRAASLCSCMHLSLPLVSK